MSLSYLEVKIGKREIIFLVWFKNIIKIIVSGNICVFMFSGKFIEVVLWDFIIIIRVFLMGLNFWEYGVRYCNLYVLILGIK